jgi:hypothetical protein
MMTTETQIPQARLIIGCGRELGGQFLLRRKNPLDFKDFPVYMAFDPLRPHKGVWPHRRDFLKPPFPPVCVEDGNSRSRAPERVRSSGF